MEEKVKSGIKYSGKYFLNIYSSIDYRIIVLKSEEDAYNGFIHRNFG
jgi:hypothetical protein